MKKIGYAVFAIFVFGIICFFIFPEMPIDENTETIATTQITTTEITTTQPTTAEITTTEATTKEFTTAKVQINARKKAATTRNVENETTTKVAETTTEEKVQPTTSHKNYTDYDVKLLAEIIYCEASGTSKDEMAKVGQVVLNRRDTTYFEFADCKTIYGVIAQDGHYTETLEKIKNGVELKNSIDEAEMEKAIEVAKGLLNGTIDAGLSKDVLWQTGFVPSWEVEVIIVSQTKWHYYSKLA